jgi:hypothetical protein
MDEGSVLDGLDAIDWSELHHAFGPAADVPEQLRALAGVDQDARDEALSWLFGTIWHQGTVYEATAPAVPFLARIARQDRLPPDDRAMLVALLGAIAAGWSYLEVHRSSKGHIAGATDDATLAREMAHVAAARAAVGREVARLITELGGIEERLDWRLAALAAQTAESASMARPLIDRLKDRTDNPRLTAALDLTAAMIGGGASSTVLEAARSVLGPGGREGADTLTRLSPDRAARIIADCLYEDGFDETHVGG